MEVMSLKFQTDLILVWSLAWHKFRNHLDLQTYTRIQQTEICIHYNQCCLFSIGMYNSNRHSFMSRNLHTLPSNIACVILLRSRNQAIEKCFLTNVEYAISIFSVSVFIGKAWAFSATVGNAINVFHSTEVWSNNRNAFRESGKWIRANPHSSLRNCQIEYNDNVKAERFSAVGHQIFFDGRDGLVGLYLVFSGKPEQLLLNICQWRSQNSWPPCHFQLESVISHDTLQT